MNERTAATLALISALLITIGIFSALKYFQGRSPDDAQATDLGSVAPFTLTDAFEAPFSAASLEGDIYVAHFFFTSCPGPCPIMVAHVADLAKAFSAEERLHFVSISVDPETDTFERLQAYGKMYEANFDRWHFLRGPIEEIRAIADDVYKVGQGETASEHSTRFILVDGNANIRGYFMGTDDTEVARMRDAITALLKEAA